MHFFGCEECRNHFLEMYDACRYGRCEPDADASLWLWRAHNVVNARTHGHVEDGYITSNTPENAVSFWAWPSVEQCASCRNGKKWDLDGVRAFLKREYGNGSSSASGVSRRGRAFIFPSQAGAARRGAAARLLAPTWPSDRRSGRWLRDLSLFAPAAAFDAPQQVQVAPLVCKLLTLCVPCTRRC